MVKNKEEFIQIQEFIQQMTKRPTINIQVIDTLKELLNG